MHQLRVAVFFKCIYSKLTVSAFHYREWTSLLARENSMSLMTADILHPPESNDDIFREYLRLWLRTREIALGKSLPRSGSLPEFSELAGSCSASPTRRQSSLPLPPRCEPFRARRSVTISESFEWLQSGSSPSVVSLPPSRSRSGSPRSGSLSPRSNRSDSLSKSFSPAAIDRLCEIVDGAKVKFLGTPVFSQGDKVIVSFPGAHGRAWNRLMQGAGGWKTSCVFAEQEYTRLWRPRHALFRPQS